MFFYILSAWRRWVLYKGASRSKSSCYFRVPTQTVSTRNSNNINHSGWSDLSWYYNQTSVEKNSRATRYTLCFGLSSVRNIFARTCKLPEVYVRDSYGLAWRRWNLAMPSAMFVQTGPILPLVESTLGLQFSYVFMSYNSGDLGRDVAEHCSL